jgi:threonine dehydrogenase-like Zn-dependent dehydrogenase
MTRKEEVEVAIIGAGPAGLTLANLLARRGVSCIAIDRYTKQQILMRARAGLLENRTVDLPRLESEGGLSVQADFVAGADSQHGISRASIPDGDYVDFVMRHEFRWLTTFSSGRSHQKGKDPTELIGMDLLG